VQALGKSPGVRQDPAAGQTFGLPQPEPASKETSGKQRADVPSATAVARRGAADHEKPWASALHDSCCVPMLR
jgi:hypothetical protein